MTEASVRTVLRMRAQPGREDEFEAAWRAAAADISRVPGNVRQELARDLQDPRTFVITSDWTDRAAVDAFGRSAARETLTAALRDLRDDASRNTYQLLATVPAVPAPPVRIDLSTTVRPGEETAFERAYQIVSARLNGTPGLIREELLKEPDSTEYHIFAEWETEQDFLNWVEDPSHADQSGPLVRWLSVDFNRRLFEIRYRPPQHVPTPGTVEFTPVATPASSSPARPVWASPATERSAPTPVPAVSMPIPPTPTPVPAVSTPSSIPPAQPAVSTPISTPAPQFPSRAVPQDGARDLPGDPPVPSASVQEFVDLPVSSPPAAETDPIAPARSVPVAAPPLSPGTRTPSLEIRDDDVLIVGAGPTGLTCAIELARRGIAVRIVDKRLQPASQADKAIGIHCRTMEIWEDQGIVTEAMDAGIWLHGQTVFVNNVQTHQVDWTGLPELPYAHLGLPQYDTERILAARLASLGVRVERGVELAAFRQDHEAVTAELRTADGQQMQGRARYLVGCDGAHSAVRTALGLTFQGGLSMFPQLFMLGDVDLDWQMPEGHLLRFVRIEDDGDFTGMLVCVPLKGHRRYRVATLAPQRLQQTIGSGVVQAGFWQEYTPPDLADIQAAIDDLAPAGTTASNLRWSSIFRVKHGIVDRYRDGRVFVAGDAAHLHPPAGGQGMNTGIQDAWNLGWKLALTMRGIAAPDLLDTYDEERRPAGKAIVDRAVAIAFTDEMDMEDEKAQFLLEMQMTMNYAGSRLVSQAPDGHLPIGGPEPGFRAPDVTGLARFGVTHPVRLFDLLRGTHATLLLWADTGAGSDQVLELEKLAARVVQQTAGQVRPYLLTEPDAAIPPLTDLPVLRDGTGAFRTAYGVNGQAAYLIRPDGHVGYRSALVSAEGLDEHLRMTYCGV